MNSGVAGGCLRHQPQRLVVEEAVGLDVLGAEIVRVVEMLDAGGGWKLRALMNAPKAG